MHIFVIKSGKGTLPLAFIIYAFIIPFVIPVYSNHARYFREHMRDRPLSPHIECSFSLNNYKYSVSVAFLFDYLCKEQRDFRMGVLFKHYSAEKEFDSLFSCSYSHKLWLSIYRDTSK